MVSLAQLNGFDHDSFVTVAGPLFEHSPWIAERTWPQRPFATRQHLHAAMCATVRAASLAEQLALIRAHPDLVGRAARMGTLTPQSEGEQAAAGLDRLSPDEVATFERFNSAYQQKFGFPFVICARQNKKETILAAFPVRLANTRAHEIATALDEVAKIAWLRLLDAVSEP